MKRIILAIAIFFVAVANAANVSIIAGIELGSKGVKGVAYEYIVSDDGSDEVSIGKKLYDKKINTTIMSGVQDNTISLQNIDETSSAIKKIYDELRNIDPQFIVIVGSTAFDKIKNKDEIVSAVKQKTGADLMFITADEEMYYGLQACVPQKRLKNAILIDIGSGNTKIGYATPFSPNGFESMTIPYGTVTMKEKAQQNSDFLNGIKSVIEMDIKPMLKKAIQKQPGLANINRNIYIVGGTPWAVSNFTHTEQIERKYITLELDDVQNFRKKLIKNQSYYEPSYGKANPEKAKKEISKVMDVFSAEDLIAGSTILEEVLSELKAGKRKIKFPREGGWLLGYMFNTYYKTK